VQIDNPRTGKAPLAEYLADVAAETRDQVAAVEGDSDDDDDDKRDVGAERTLLEGLRMRWTRSPTLRGVRLKPQTPGRGAKPTRTSIR